MEPWLSATVLFLAALAQGFLGFGYGILAMGVLTLTNELLYASAIVNVTGCALTISMTILLRRSVMWHRVRRIFPWAAAGVFGGLFLLGSAPSGLLVRLLGVTVVAIAVWNLRGAPLSHEPAPSADRWAGVGAGLLSGAFNMAGPPLIAHLYRLPDPPDSLRGTVQALFVLTSLVRLGGALLGGQVTAATTWDALVMVPFVLAGMVTGVALGRRTSTDRFRRSSWTAFAALGLYLATVGGGR